MVGYLSPKIEVQLKGPKPVKYAFGDYVLDIDKRALFRGAGFLVTDKERIITALSLMARLHPRTATRKEILQEVWPHRDVSDWALSRLMADVRRLLGTTQGSKDYIKTVHGRGFRISMDVQVLADCNLASSVAKTASELIESHPPQPKIINKAVIILIMSLTSTVGFIAIIVGHGSWFNDIDSFALQQYLPNEQRLMPTMVYEAIGIELGWSINFHGQYQVDGGKISYFPQGRGQSLSFNYSGPRKFNQAAVLFEISVDQAYLNSGASLKIFAVKQAGDPVDQWDCLISSEKLRRQATTFVCPLQDAGGPLGIKHNEHLIFGVVTLEDDAQGKVTISAVGVRHAVSLALVERD